jgi:hypothetical protein
VQLNKEQVLWNEIKMSNDPAVFEDFLKRYPSGDFAALARSRLQEVQKAKLRPEIPNLIPERRWREANKSIEDLLNLSPNDAEALGWRKQVYNLWRGSQRKKAETTAGFQLPVTAMGSSKNI